MKICETPTTTRNWNCPTVCSTKTGPVGTSTKCSTSCGSRSGVRDGMSSKLILGTSITCLATTSKNVTKNWRTLHHQRHRHRHEGLDGLRHTVVPARAAPAWPGWQGALRLAPRQTTVRRVPAGEGEKGGACLPELRRLLQLALPLPGRGHLRFPWSGVVL